MPETRRCQLLPILAASLLGAVAASSISSTVAERRQVAQGSLVPSVPVPNIDGTGYCELPSYNQETSVTHIVCYGPPLHLHPGEATNILARLEPNPYPENQMLLLLNQTTQIVAENNRPVPLSEVYFHHFAASYRFLGTLGTEARGVSGPFPAPYGRVINGSFMADKEWRQCNIELVSQVGVREEDRKQCVECWCDDKASAGQAPFAPTETVNGHKVPVTRFGSFLCCRQCPTTMANHPPTPYRLQYNLTYRSIAAEEHFIPLDQIVLDVSADHVEYQIPEALGPNSTHVQVFDTTIDHQCPQGVPLSVVRCQAHQHFGAKCMELIDLSNNHTICRSCPVVGTEQDVPGNELGYIVDEREADVVPAYVLQPGTPIRIQSEYDASVPRFGLMGLMWTWVAGMDHPCRPNPGPDVPAPHQLPVGPSKSNPLHTLA